MWRVKLFVSRDAALTHLAHHDAGLGFAESPALPA
jgi:hypothetical protein